GVGNSTLLRARSARTMGAVLKVATLVRHRAFGLRVLAAQDALDRPVGWVHVSELADPTPFLRPGTLLLTTGLQPGPADEYVSRLVKAEAVGLGFGVGLSHVHTPEDLTNACARMGLPLLEVPLATRFADIVRFVADDMANTAVRAVKSTVDIERALIRALAAPDVPKEVVTRLAKWLGGWAMVLDRDAAMKAVSPAKARQEHKAVRTELERIEPTGRFSVSWEERGTQIS